MNKGLSKFAIFLLIITFFLNSSMLLAAEILPPRPPTLGPHTDGIPLQERYEAEVYYFDYLNRIDEPAERAFLLFINQLLICKAWLLKMAFLAVEYAFTADILAPLFTVAGQVMDALYTWLWEMDGSPLVVGALAVVGLWVLIATLARRLTHSLQVLGGTSLILIVSYGLLGTASEVLPTLQQLSKTAGQQSIELVGAVSRAGNGSALIEKAGAALWEPVVYQPWVAMEFLNQSTAISFASNGLLGARVLEMNQIDRINFIHSEGLIDDDNHRFFYSLPSYHLKRCLVAVVSFVAGILSGVPLLFLAGGILVSQIVLLVLLALLPLWLLLALWWPGRGLQVLQSVLLVGLSALFRQFILAVNLALLLVLTLTLGPILADFGWVLSSLVLGVLALTVYRYRYAWLPGKSSSREMIREQVAGKAPQVRFQAEQDYDLSVGRGLRTDNIAPDNIEPTELEVFLRERVKPREEGDIMSMPQKRVRGTAAAPAEFHREMAALRQRLGARNN